MQVWESYLLVAPDSHAEFVSRFDSHFFQANEFDLDSTWVDHYNIHDALVWTMWAWVLFSDRRNLRGEGVGWILLYVSERRAWI